MANEEKFTTDQIIVKVVDNTIRSQLAGEAKRRFNPEKQNRLEISNTPEVCPVCGGESIASIILRKIDLDKTSVTQHVTEVIFFYNKSQYLPQILLNICLAWKMQY